MPRQCSQCLKVLSGNQTKFCSEKCGIEFHNTQLKYKKERDKKTQEIRYCKYVLCQKELPKGINSLKMYCPGTNCSYKMNQLQQKQRREEDKKNREPVIRNCALESCGKEFEVAGHNTRQSYCTAGCRNKATKLRQAIHQKENTKLIKETKIMKKLEPENKTGKIDKRWLHRNLSAKSSNQIATMMGEA